ncbi:hypothetical protein WJX73_005969 [Symbiochloris irregularis]|uniref:ACT domain-containing protein n=1 Tax=Symbiochloris irregularis TaxID=706552 RepID=A0AAW1P1B1_9CHLO
MTLLLHSPAGAALHSKQSVALSVAAPQLATKGAPQHHQSRANTALSGRVNRPVISRAVTEEQLRTEELLTATQSIDLEPIGEGDYCLPGEVSVDNESCAEATILSVEVKDYPGLLRVVAWVLNGLDYLVQNARLTSDDEGYAHNRFWVVQLNGKKLSNKAAALLAERVGDFVVYCTPNRRMLEADRFGDERFSVNNAEHEKCSIVRIATDQGPGALLQIASAMSGVGVSIHEAVIQGAEQSCGAPKADPHFDAAKRGRLFQFWVTDRRGDKLDYARATALIYTMNLAFGGQAHGPTTAPNSGPTPAQS